MFKLIGQNIYLSNSSLVKYHTTFEIEAYNSLILNGTVRQNDPNEFATLGEVSTIRIYAGNPLNNLMLNSSVDPLVGNNFIIGNEALLRAESILIFADKPLMVYGNIENTYEDQNDEIQIINSCISVSNTLKSYDVFT